MRYAAKRDNAESAIVQALAAAGCKVVKLSQAGIPDLLVATPENALVLLEVKDRQGKLTEAQQEQALPFHVVRTPEAALAIIEQVRGV